jgi:hypothetical protein
MMCFYEENVRFLCWELLCYLEYSESFKDARFLCWELLCYLEYSESFKDASKIVAYDGNTSLTTWILFLYF